MVDQYTWELGIDFEAIVNTGRSYLRHGFVKNTENGGEMNRLWVKVGDQITFKIFDVTSFPVGDPTTNRIKSFTIFVKAATTISEDREVPDPITPLQLTFADLPTLPPPPHQEGGETESTAFGGQFPVFLATAPVTVTTQGRFLVSFLVQAGPAGGHSRVFAVDPEMVIGPDG